MTTITIRDVPEATRDELAERAARSGTSMQSDLRDHLLEVGSRPDRSVVLEWIVDRKRRIGTLLPAEAIVAGRRGSLRSGA